MRLARTEASDSMTCTQWHVHSLHYVALDFMVGDLGPGSTLTPEPVSIYLLELNSSDSKVAGHILL